MVDLVVAHDPNWKADFDAEKRAIKACLRGVDIMLHHIGSTAIERILAKPIIDLLGVVSDLSQVDANARAMEGLGYEVMGAFGIEGRRYFRKITADGRRTHQLHIYEKNSPHIERHLAFREYLREHANVASAYSDLKETLVSVEGQTWGGYLDGKDAFIIETEKDALEWYQGSQSI
ncbi:dephospho-CoA kinase/protein folding accessory domain-containing protein [Octadecabacter ascidiaceicola]|uniref:Dephospho-CoA kinase/protein folding accessory domain-containing protein n=2 Tax=Octadecabacter ascidiaceicola TaxID=1655543 RepID=A0A238K5L5_9RHOB|nr:dephospho-CoA kinase/protein folding accessory domain-containing protein [Octadecabacter ascidiaceicola]